MSSEQPSSHIQAFDPATYQPEQVPDAQCIDRGPDEPPESRFILVRASGRHQVVISDEDRVIWSLFDGKTSVNDISERYLARHRTLVLTRLYSLVQRLWAHGFLTADPHIAPIVEHSRFWLWRLKPVGWFRLPLVGSQLPIKWCANVLRTLPLDSVVGLGVTIVLIALGLVLFGNLPDTARYPLLKVAQDYTITGLGTIRESYVSGIVLLAILHLVFSFVHAFMRGSVENALVRRVTPITIQLNYFIPVFAHEARWAPLLPIRRRLIASGAGIVTELLLGALGTGLLYVFSPAGWQGELIYKCTCILYLRTFLHFSPLPGSDFPDMLRQLSNVKHFRERAFGFLCHGFLKALSGDIQLQLQHKLYIAFNIVSVFWLGLAAVFSLGLLTTNIGVLSNLSYVFMNADNLTATSAESASSPIAHEMLLLANARYLLAIVMGLFLCLVLLSLLLAIAWGCYILAKTLYQMKIWRLSTVLVSTGLAGVILFLASLTFLLRQGLLLPYQAVSILHGMTFIIGLGGALIVAYRIKHLGKSWIGVKFAGLCLAVLGTTISLWFECQSPPVLGAVAILQSLALVMILVAIIAGLGSRLHLGAFWGTQLFLPELAIVMGGFVTAAGAIRAITNSSFLAAGAVDHNRFVGIALVLIGVIVSNRLLRDQDLVLDSLAVDLSKDDKPKALKRIIAFVLESVSRLVAAKFGEEALNAMENRINRGKDTPEFTFASIHVSDDMEVEEIGKLYRERFEKVRDVIASIYGDRFADQVFDSAFTMIHWECKEVLNSELFPGSRWEGQYVEDEALDGLKRSRLIDAISIFKELSASERQLLVRHSIACSFPANQLIVTQSDFGDACYIIVKGEVQVEERDSTGETDIVAFMKPGDFFGESALLSGAARAASVRATTDCQLLALTRTDFEKFSERSPEMVHHIKDRLYNLRTLLRIPLFGDLSPALLRAVLPRIRAAHFAPGEQIITAGEIGRELYLIKSGRVEVLLMKGDQEEQICELGPKEYFGEIALLQDIPRTATVRSIQPTELLILTKDDFTALVSQSTLFARTVEIVGSRRLRMV